MQKIKRFIQTARALLRGPRYKIGTVVVYQQSLNRVDDFRFDFAKQEYVYALCGYGFDWFTEVTIESMVARAKGRQRKN